MMFFTACSCPIDRTWWLCNVWVCLFVAHSQVDMAVVLYSCLINKDSFPLILEQFEVPADRENVCHRLYIEIDPEGNVMKRPK